MKCLDGSWVFLPCFATCMRTSHRYNKKVLRSVVWVLVLLNFSYRIFLLHLVFQLPRHVHREMGQSYPSSSHSIMPWSFASNLDTNLASSWIAIAFGATATAISLIGLWMMRRQCQAQEGKLASNYYYTFVWRRHRKKPTSLFHHN